MMDDYDYFLMIAEESNISRAAKRAYISQQSLSKYLKRLEEAHGVPLFTRKPEFALTPAGRIVLEKVLQIKALQSDMRRKLAELGTDPHGEIHLGVTPGRGEEILPLVFPPLHECYPNVRLVAKIGMTSKMLVKVQRGEMDIVVAVNPEITPDLKEILLFNEPFCLVASNALLQRYFPLDFPRCKLRFANGVDIREFKDIPFIGNSPDSHFHTLTDKYLAQYGVTLHEIFHMDTGIIHLTLAQQGMGACFLPLMLKRCIAEMNRNVPMAQQLNVFPLKGHMDSNRISLVLLKHRNFPPYIEYFISLLSEKIMLLTQPDILNVETIH